MKKLLKSASVLLIILLACLLSHKSHTIGAYPENLWTRPGHFSHPSTTVEVLTWSRTEYGIVWAWLVHDSCTSERAWYVRIEPRYLMIYVAASFFGGLATFFLTGRRSKFAEQIADGKTPESPQPPY